MREHPMLPLSASYTTVAVGEAEGLLAVSEGEVTVAWPVPGSDLWATLSVSGATDPDLARRLAAGVTFTDRSTWEALYTGNGPADDEPTETTIVVDTTISGTATSATSPAEIDVTVND